jgi:hypothetical protein
MSIFRRAFRTVRSAVGFKRTLGENQDERANAGEAASTDQSDMVEAFTLGHCSDDSSLHHCQVEFIGGPLDGLTQRLPVAFEELAIVVAIPISPRGLAKLTGSAAELAGKPSLPTTVAFYELDVEQLGPTRYLFLGATNRQEISLS